MTYIKRIQKRLINTLRNTLICSLLLFTGTLQAKEYDDKQINCLAKNTYMEARGEGEKGMLATIFVVLNRTKDPRFPSTPCKVIAQPNQFEWWGKGKTIKEPDMYEKAKELVYEVLEGKHKDFTKGSIYFNAHHKAPKGTVCSVRIGNHSFYREVKKTK